MKTLLTTAALALLPLALADTMGVAPAFRLADASGKAVSLAALKGQPVVLTFWATWCPSCKSNLPLLEAEAARLGFKNHFALSATDSAPDAYAYFQKAGFRAVRALAGTAGGQNASSVARAYRVIGQPVTVFIDPRGQVVARHSGVLSAAQYRESLAKAGLKAAQGDGKP